VVLIVADDVAYEDLMPLLPQLPNIKRIVGAGTTFHSAYANGVCSPSRQSLQLGRWRFGDMGRSCSNQSQKLSIDEVTLAELNPGSSGLFGKWHIGANPLGHWSFLYQSFGYSTWFGTPVNLGGALADPNDCECIDYRDWTRVIDGIVTLHTTGYQPIAVRDAATAWWSATGGRRLLDYRPALAHGPNHNPPATLLPPGYVVAPGQRGKFEAMIVALDTTLEPILDGVDWTQDLVIFVGDNGTPEQVSPAVGKSKTTTFERGIHVPLFVSGPGFRATSTDTLVHVVDIYTTIADFFGTVPPAHDGLSLVATPGHDWVVCTGTNDLMARTGTVKLRRLVDTGDEQLFDLSVDSTESVSLLDDPNYAAVVIKLRSVLDEFQTRGPDFQDRTP
jgi:arylsulfatase A-like enzyme